MNRKLVLLCAAATLLFVFASANVASAQTAEAPAGCPCSCAVASFPCKFATPACPPVWTYRIGPFGAIRPVVYAPVYRVPVVRPVYVPPPRFYRPVVCPPYYVW